MTANSPPTSARSRRRLTPPIALPSAWPGQGRFRQKRLHKITAGVWKTATAIHATNDLETALAADTRRKQIARVLVLSGTGSCCFGQTPDGTTSKLGGWGHILGDKGSGYEIGLRALKACVFYLDRDGTWSALGQRILRRLQLNEPDQLIDWVARRPSPRSLTCPKRCSPHAKPSATKSRPIYSTEPPTHWPRTLAPVPITSAKKPIQSGFLSPVACYSGSPSLPPELPRPSAPADPVRKWFH